MAYYGAAILPVAPYFDGYANPFTAEMDNELKHEHTVLYVMAKPGRTRPTRVLSSAGDLGSAWAIGTTHELYHDQTGGQLGTYTVVGINDEDGRTWGDCPNRKIALAVFK